MGINQKYVKNNAKVCFFFAGMAAQTNGHLAVPNPMEVGDDFVKQYFHTLTSSPDLIHKFYHEGSEVSRPGPDGEMTSITNIQVRHEYCEWQLRS